MEVITTATDWESNELFMTDLNRINNFLEGEHVIQVLSYVGTILIEISVQTIIGIGQIIAESVHNRNR